MSTRDNNILSQPLQLSPYLLSHRQVQTMSSRVTDQLADHLSSGLVLASPYNVAHWNLENPVTLDQIQDEWQTRTWEAHKSDNTIFLPLVYYLPPLHPKSWRMIPRRWVRPDSIRAVINRLTEIAREHYQRAATKALEAGFDGIEVMISPGSLIDHLLRSDIYRFSEAANRESYFDRFRLLSEVIRAVHQVWNLRQIGVRFSSLTNGTIAQEHTADALLKYVVYRLNDYGLSFVHLSEADSDASSVAAALRPYYDGVLIGRGDYTEDSAAHAIESGHVDLVSLLDA